MTGLFTILILFLLPSSGFLAAQVAGVVHGQDVPLRQTEKGTPEIASFLPSEYGLNSYVGNVVQDEQGFVYVATNSGMSRFDGARWQLIDDLYDQSIYQMLPLGGNRLMVTHFGDFGYLYYDESGLTHFKSNRYLLPPDAVDEQMFLTTFTMGKLIFIRTPFRLLEWYPDHYVRSISLPSYERFEAVFGLQGEVYLAQDRIIYRVDRENGDKFIRIFPMSGQNNTSMNRFSNDSGGLIYITDVDNNLFTFDGVTLKPFIVANNGELKASLINCLLILSNGNLAVGTAIRGVYIYSPEGELIQHLDESSGLNANLVLNLWEDADCGLWVAQNLGLCRVDYQSPVSYYGSANGLEASIIDIERHLDSIFLATDQGIFYSVPEKSREKGRMWFEHIDGTWGRCENLVSTSEGVFFYMNNAMYLFNGGAIEQQIDQFRSLCISDNAPDLLIGVNQYFNVVFYERKNGAWLQKGDMMPTTFRLHESYVAPSGEIWFKSNPGQLVRLTGLPDAPKLIEYTTEDGLPNQWINPILLPGQTLIGSREGIHRFLPEEDRFVPADEYHFVMDNEVFDFRMGANYDENHWWVNYGKGCGLFIRDESGAFQLKKGYLRELNNKYIGSLFSEPSGRIWFGDERGLFSYDFDGDVESKKSQRNTRITLVTDLHNNDYLPLEKYYIEGPDNHGLPLAYNQRALRFDFTVLSMNSPDALAFQFILEGFDSGWSEWTKERYKEYSNLPEGHYIFKVKAKNPDGSICPEATFPFNISAPWYRTYLAYFCYGLGAILVILSFAQWRSYRLKSSNRKLKELVDLRTQEVSEKNHQLEIALEKSEQLAEDAQAAARAKSRFLATMSHEIRTPMNGVIGMSSLLCETPLTTQQMDFVNTIRHSGEALLRIINDILDFSKIEAGGLELEHIPFDLGECVEEVLDLLAPEAFRKHLEIAAKIDPELPLSRIGDPTRVRQILMNLAGNAIKFTAKGEVVISVERQDPDAPDFDATLVRFIISDTGIGIPEDRKDLLFKPFTQVDSSTVRKFGGTGLGLSISKRLVDCMQGKIWLESTYGEGTEFYIELNMPLDPVGETRETGISDFKGKRILIVDDNHTNCRILEQLAEFWEMLPKSTEVAPEALEILNNGESYDVAILDYNMPEMNGLTLAGKIRQSSRGKDMPIVMFSSSSFEGEVDIDSLKLSGVLRKPLRKKQLSDLLKRIFRRVDRKRQIPSAGESEGEIAKISMPPIKARILLVEDNRVNQKVVQLMLKRLGLSADLAANGYEVIEAFERQYYDIVLMDVQMPEMDGVEATKRLRKMKFEEGSPWIIAQTAGVTEDERIDYRDAGMDDFLPKPITLADLKNKLNVTRESLDT